MIQVNVGFFSQNKRVPEVPLTWKHLTYDVGKVADNGKHHFLSKICVGCVISVQQNKR